VETRPLPYLRHGLTTTPRRDNSLCQTSLDYDGVGSRPPLPTSRRVPPNVRASKRASDLLLVDYSSHTLRRARKRFRHRANTCSTEPLVSCRCCSVLLTPTPKTTRTISPAIRRVLSAEREKGFDTARTRARRNRV